MSLRDDLGHERDYSPAAPAEQFLLELSQLDKIRESLGLSVQDVVERSGQSRTTVWRIFTGNTGVALSSVLSVLRVLKLNAPDSEVQAYLREHQLPLHPLSLQSAPVDDALERAAAAAVAVLDELFEGEPPETAGINSNFQGLLKDHLAAMLTGAPAARCGRVALNRLVYTEAEVGGPQTAPSSQNLAGWVVRLDGADTVLRELRFVPLAHFPNSEAFVSRDYAVQHFLERYLPAEGHPPGPVSAVPVFYAGDHTLQLVFE